MNFSLWKFRISGRKHFSNIEHFCYNCKNIEQFGSIYKKTIHLIMNTIATEKIMWLTTFIYWLASAFFTRKAMHRQAGGQRILYILCYLFAFGLLFQDLPK